MSDTKQEQAHIGSDAGEKQREQAHIGSDKRREQKHAHIGSDKRSTHGRVGGQARHVVGLKRVESSESHVDRVASKSEAVVGNSKAVGGK